MVDGNFSSNLRDKDCGAGCRRTCRWLGTTFCRLFVRPLSMVSSTPQIAHLRTGSVFWDNKILFSNHFFDEARRTYFKKRERGNIIFLARQRRYQQKFPFGSCPFADAIRVGTPSTRILWSRIKISLACHVVVEDKK